MTIAETMLNVQKGHRSCWLQVKEWSGSRLRVSSLAEVVASRADC